MNHIARDEYLVRAREFAARGNALPHAKLNPGLVRMIRRSAKTTKKLALEIGVHYRTIEKVRHYETWGHIHD